MGCQKLQRHLALTVVLHRGLLLTRLSTRPPITLYIRAIALFAAAWCLIFCLPLLFAYAHREQRSASCCPPPTAFLGSVWEASPPKWAAVCSPLANAVTPFAQRKMTSPQTLWFLIASAVFRDGLSGIFTFGGILAAGAFGFTSEVILFGIAGKALSRRLARSWAATWMTTWARRRLLLSRWSALSWRLPAAVLPSAGRVLGMRPLLLCLFVGPAQSCPHLPGLPGGSRYW